MNKLSLPLAIIALLVSVFSLAQSSDHNYVKTTEYLESVLIDDKFTSSFGGWLENGSVNLSLDNGRLKANVNSAYEGVKHPLTGFVTTAGKVLNVNITFDKGNTLSTVRLYLHEVDPSGNLVNYNLKDDNLTTGTHQYNHIMSSSGNSIALRIDKANTNTSSETYFFIDYVSLKLGTNTPIKKLESVTYLDGFGKEKQTVGIKQTASQKDIIQHIEYDEFGRVSKQYLPLPTSQSTGNYIVNPVSQINTYYQTNFSDQHPFSETIFDDSPLNRVIESSSPGNTWQIVTASDTDHTTKFTYRTNESEEVIQFIIDDLNPNFPLQRSYYAPNTLLKNSVKNENWVPTDGLLNTKDVFSDKNGRKIAEFTYELVSGSVKKLSTYYVYDDIGNLRYILTPKMFDGLFGINNYLVSWPTGDFLTVGNAGVSNVTFSVNDGVITVSCNNKKGLIADKQLNVQTTKALSTSAPLPNLYLGEVFGVVDFIGGEIETHIGDAQIINGNFQINRVFNGNFKRLVIFITVDLIQNAFSQQALDDLAFQYKYDIYNRQIEQKVPGKDWEYMVYDQLDRPILTQDANLRAQSKWLFNKYDAFGRVVYNGLYTSSSTRAALQTQVDNFINSNPTNASNIEERRIPTLFVGGIAINYTSNAFPTTSTELLTVNYYDDYSFIDSSLPSPLPTSILGQSVTTRTKGLLTSSWTKTLGSVNWAKNYTFYDQKGRVVYVYDKNYVGGYTKNESKLDFRGKIEESITKHKRVSVSTELTITDFFEYDHVERPKKHYQKINSQLQELISEQEYNELGQLKSKKVGGAITNTNPLQKIDYTYNIRGWLKNVNDVNNLGNDLFAYQIKYDEAIEGNAIVSDAFNGNIKQVIWKSAYNNVKKSYAYNYDKLNRFIKSSYRDGATLTSNGGKFETYDVRYDANGNITQVKRNNQSSVLMDRLSYNYDDGNQLLYIDDSADTNTDGFYDGNTTDDDYTYDTNGNLIRDLNKDITSIEYNHLDLVKKVTFGNGNRIEFTYDANGNKLQMKTIIFGGATTTIDYYGGFQYTNNQLQFFPTPEGYVSVNGSTFKYIYLYDDCLGNNRLSYSDTDGSGVVGVAEIQSNTDYYVMGLTHYGEFVSNSNYTYKYQGKEQLAFTGYNMYDFGSRMYDASVGRWFNTDPQNQFSSPYLAMGNNPVMVIDPDGELAWFIPIIAGAVIGGVNTAIQNPRADFSDIFNGTLLGAANGAITAGIGGLTAGISSVGTQALVSAGAHGIVQGGYSMVNGGSFWSGAAIGFGSSLLSSATSGWGAGGQIATGAFSGGIISELSGGNFGQGFTSGLIVSGLNHALHRTAIHFERKNIIKDLLEKYGYESNDKFIFTTQGNYTSEVIQFIHSIPELANHLSEFAYNPEIKAYPDQGHSSSTVAEYDHHRHRISLYSKAFKTYYRTVSTLFHEGFHSFQHKSGFVSFLENKYSERFNIKGGRVNAILESQAYKIQIYLGDTDPDILKFYQRNINMVEYYKSRD